MHDQLRRVFSKTVELFQTDPRVLAGFITGSVGSSHEDELSDVDPVFIIREGEFDSFERDLPAVFAGLCDEIVLWWPERFNKPGSKNFAILFYAGQTLLQYDINFHIPPKEGLITVEPCQFLFDKAAILHVQKVVPPPPADSQRILWLINAYWVWIYIHAKYLRRRDIVKLVYVQQQLFDVHLELVGVINPQVRIHAWWPLAVKAIDDMALRQTLMSYLLQDNPDTLKSKLPGQIEQFIKFARGVCEQFGIAYPSRVESEVYAHLEKNLR